MWSKKSRTFGVPFTTKGRGSRRGYSRRSRKPPCKEISTLHIICKATYFRITGRFLDELLEAIPLTVREAKASGLGQKICRPSSQDRLITSGIDSLAELGDTLKQFTCQSAVNDQTKKAPNHPTDSRGL